MHIHEIIYSTTVKDSNNSTLCVINFAESHILRYDRMTVLFHSLGPFIIQILSITSLITLIARNRAKVNTRRSSNSFYDLLLKQFKEHKELYINPSITILSTLPQIILSFSLACTEFSLSWKRYVLLTTYFLSYLPQMLSLILHILPSSLYKKEFHQTFMYKTIIHRVFNSQHDQ